MTNAALPVHNFGYATIVANVPTLKSPNLSFVHVGAGHYQFTPGVPLVGHLTFCPVSLIGGSYFARSGVDSGGVINVYTAGIDGNTLTDADFSLLIWTVGTSAIDSNP